MPDGSVRMIQASHVYAETPSGDISASMAPSPSLSMLMATTTYLIDVTRNRVQTTSDRMPRIRSGVASPWRNPKAVFRARAGRDLCRPGSNRHREPGLSETTLMENSRTNGRQSGTHHHSTVRVSGAEGWQCSNTCSLPIQPKRALGLRVRDGLLRP